MSNIQNKTVLVTGGASGIGKLMGELCLKEGARRLIIWDINKDNLLKVSEELIGKGYEVHIYQVDLSKPDQIIKHAHEVKDNIGDVDILFNNAGVIVGKMFHEHTHDDINNTMSVNADALMHVTLEFLPAMIAKKSGHIINIASAAGLMSNPKMSVYCASKHAVIGWSESLRLELEEISNNLRVTTVTPSYISTGMFDGVRSPIVPLLKPEVAAKQVIDGVKSNAIFVRMPKIVYSVPFLKGLLPARWMDHVTGKWFGFHKSMDEFRGRN